METFESCIELEWNPTRLMNRRRRGGGKREEERSSGPAKTRLPIAPTSQTNRGHCTDIFSKGSWLSLMNLRQHSTVSNRHFSQQLAQFIIVPHSQLNMPRSDPVLLIFEDGGEVNRTTRSDTFCISAGFKVPGNSADGELKTGF
ncbi:hypothetical protein Ccrd_003505 [Cynara cardunculus var. scolymus]|uniref:Uncharacterized protein n=1 Tax=Cynara cardunculus var. scolymus TaxID=59895 RepID=A0A103XPA3_CYNCS|nr:hypothetical protein Ccrd_003505 [Cynara cardunculus var. scolymus]